MKPCAHRQRMACRRGRRARPRRAAAACWQSPAGEIAAHLRLGMRAGARCDGRSSASRRRRPSASCSIARRRANCTSASGLTSSCRGRLRSAGSAPRRQRARIAGPPQGTRQNDARNAGSANASVSRPTRRPAPHARQRKPMGSAPVGSSSQAIASGSSQRLAPPSLFDLDLGEQRYSRPASPMLAR